MEALFASAQRALQGLVDRPVAGQGGRALVPLSRVAAASRAAQAGPSGHGASRVAAAQAAFANQAHAIVADRTALAWRTPRWPMWRRGRAILCRPTLVVAAARTVARQTHAHANDRQPEACGRRTNPHAMWCATGMRLWCW